MAEVDADAEKEHITHEGRYADLRGGDYAEIAVGEVVKEGCLWRRAGMEDDEDYDDVGPPAVGQTVLLMVSVIRRVVLGCCGY